MAHQHFFLVHQISLIQDHILVEIQDLQSPGDLFSMSATWNSVSCVTLMFGPPAPEQFQVKRIVQIFFQMPNLQESCRGLRIRAGPLKQEHTI